MPSLPTSHSSFFEYPIVWEILGGLLVGGAYALIAVLAFKRARIHAFNLVPFTRAGATLLGEADDIDRVNFAEDLFSGTQNIARLIKFAFAWQQAENHGARVEFERLGQIGAIPEIRGRPPISAFYKFAHRTQLKAASQAIGFLRIISDPQFCSVLVRKCSWRTASLLNALSERTLYVEEAKPLIQEIARQAILNDESMMAKEDSYTGFGTAPILSRSLFDDRFILFHYDPLGGLQFNMPEEPTSGYVSRLTLASKMMLKCAIKNHEYWQPTYMYSTKCVYENLFRHWSYQRYQEQQSGFSTELSLGVRALWQETVTGVGKLEVQRRRSLFVTDHKGLSFDLIGIVAEIVYDSLEAISNSFSGFDDPAWLHAITAFMDIYPCHSNEPAGMNPLQQQLAVHLIHKLRQNMEGRYPTISRVILATIGPYEDDEKITKRTAYVILKDAVYKELQKLPNLYVREQDKIARYLPSNVTYVAASNSLIHNFRMGAPQVTNLSALRIPEVNLFDENIWEDLQEVSTVTLSEAAK
jgi:hypothetical protein